MAYATTTDLAEILGAVPVGASVLLIRASRDIDQALLCAVYDTTDPDVVAALRDATVEQVAGMVAAGDTSGLGVRRPTGFSIGSLSVQGGDGAVPDKVGPLYRQAWLVLQAAGLTGYGPGDA